MMELTLEKIILEKLNEHLSNNKFKIPAIVFDEIVDYMKFTLTTEYLKITDWNIPVSMSDLAAMSFREGNYHFQDENGEAHTVSFN